MWIRTARIQPYDGFFFNLDHFDSIACIEVSSYIAANEIPEEDVAKYNPEDLIVVACPSRGAPFIPLARIRPTEQQGEIAEKMLGAIASGLKDNRGLLDLLEWSRTEGFDFSQTE